MVGEAPRSSHFQRLGPLYTVPDFAGFLVFGGLYCRKTGIFKRPHLYAMYVFRGHHRVARPLLGPGRMLRPPGGGIGHPVVVALELPSSLKILQSARVIQ